MFGLLNVNKPKSLTSRDVVNRAQSLIRPLKVGHAGTLDPLATGVLVLCIGKATRLIQYVQRMPKQYCGTFALGKKSDTEDVDGRVVDFATHVRPTYAELEQTLKPFVGTRQQLPPAYSALKVQGQRAYKLARQGAHVELRPRKITIHQLQLIEYDYPLFKLQVTCGSGTYIRSLGRDVADCLGTGAIMTDLQRTAVGPFRVEESCDARQLTSTSIARHLQPALRAVPDLPVVQVSRSETERIWRGLSIPNRIANAGEEIAACDESGRLVAILTRRNEQLRPLRNFPEA